MAREERIFAAKAAANETFRAELQAMVDSYAGPQKILAQMQTEQATAKMDELTHAAFSQDWLRVLVTQAMNVALKAQHMGISITPPQPATPDQPMQQQQHQEHQHQQLIQEQLQAAQQQAGQQSEAKVYASSDTPSSAS